MVSLLTTAIVYALTFVIAYFAIKLFWKKQDTVKRPPCIRRLPLVGSLLSLPDLSILHVFFQEKAKEIGNIIAFYMCNRYVVVLNGRDTIQDALVKQSLIFADRPKLYLTDYFDEYDKGIIQHPYNEVFKNFHRLSLKILKTFGFGQGIMETRIKVEVDNLLKLFNLKNGQAIDPSFEITASVSNVICSIIFGQRFELDDPKFKKGLDIIHLHVKGVEKLVMVNFFPILRFVPTFRKSVEKQLEVRRHWRQYATSILESSDDLKSKDSFYKSAKLELENEGMDPKEVKDRLIVTIKDLFLAGTETTATTLQWFIIVMANYQDIQKLIRNEMDRVVGEHRHPCLEDKPNLPLIEATILEVMRFRTLVPLAVPHLTSKDTYLNGLFIPANTMVFVNLHSCHMDPDVWIEPEKFNIYRFLDETKSKVINRDQMVSFSLGKRSCFGEILARQEMFLFASALVHEFEIYPPIGEEQIDMTEKVGVTNSPSVFKARFIKRQL